MTSNEFAEYVQGHYGTMSSFVRHTRPNAVPNDSDAEDVLQNALIRLWSAHPIINPSAPGPYFFVTLCHAKADFWRRRNRRADHFDLGEAAGNVPAPAELPAPSAEELARLRTRFERIVADFNEDETLLTPVEKRTFAVAWTALNDTQKAASILLFDPTDNKAVDKYFNDKHRAFRKLRGAIADAFSPLEFAQLLLCIGFEELHRIVTEVFGRDFPEMR